MTTARLVRGFAACLLGLAGLAVGASPAHAGNPSFDFRSPLKGQTVTSEAVPFHLRVSMPTSDGRLVGNVTVNFAVPQGAAAVEAVNHNADGQRSVDVTRPLTLRWNGPYTAYATARGRNNALDGDTNPRHDNATFVVDALPQPPADVTATVDEATRVVTVSWTPNPEPDLIGYEVQKQSSDGEWVHFTATSEPTVTDEATAYAGGTYHYRVAALRRAGDHNLANQSSFSATSAEVAAPPPGTPPPPEGGGGSGAGRGGQQTGSGTNNQTGGPNGGTGGGSGSGQRAGTAGSGPPLESSGKVDLSDFHSLMAQAERQKASGGRIAEDDGTFDPNLPFAGRDGSREADDEEAGDEPALGAAGGDDITGRLQSFGFLAGGLLATVLAMHVLWIRSEVYKAEKAEALVTEPPEPRSPVSPEARFGFSDARETAGVP